MLLCWFGVVVMGLCSGFMLKTVSITRRMFSLLHRIMAFFTSHSTRERAESTQDAGQVTADPNWSEEHSIPYSIALINKIARSFSAVQGLSGLGWWQASGFFCPSYFFSFSFFSFSFFSLLNCLTQPMSFIPFALLVLFPISPWRSEWGLAVYWGQITIAIKKKCHQIPLDFFSCLLQIMTYLTGPGSSLVTLGLNKNLLFMAWIFLKTEVWVNNQKTNLNYKGDEVWKRRG